MEVASIASTPRPSRGRLSTSFRAVRVHCSINITVPIALAIARPHCQSRFALRVFQNQKNHCVLITQTTRSPRSILTPVFDGALPCRKWLPALGGKDHRTKNTWCVSPSSRDRFSLGFLRFSKPSAVVRIIGQFPPQVALDSGERAST